MFRFSRGDRCPVQWIAITGTVVQTLNIKAHNLEFDVAVWDASHTQNGANTSILCGKGDAQGTVVADLDLDLMPTDAPPNIVPGVPGLMLFYIAPEQFFLVGMRVVKLYFASSTETAVQYTFDVKMDADNGPIVFPLAPFVLSPPTPGQPPPLANDIPALKEALAGLANAGGTVANTVLNAINALANSIVADAAPIITTTTVTVSNANPAIDAVVTVTATVAGLGGKANAGTVTFLKNGQPFSAMAVDNTGVASVFTDFQAVGPVQVAAVFQGADANTFDSDSAPVTVTAH